MVSGKRLAIMQPYFLPHLGYFQLIAAVDKLVIYDDVNFINAGWINRNRILLNGAPHMFTVPLQAASQNKLIHEIGLAQDDRWRDKTLRTIALHYKKAPRYLEVMPMLERIFKYPVTRLDTFILHSLEEVMRYVGLRTVIQPSSQIYGNRELRGQARILDICKIEGAQVYVNTPGGRDLYDCETFKANGIQLKFLGSKPIVYDQKQGEFFGSLSVIDVLMFNDLQAIQKMLGNMNFIMPEI
ncbi:WbqC family protein [Rhodoferax sp. AJA081-3]|uniref:WbqC family protein n=1 Tax=Rhodoferax sp. AJA081-3 TaxID=2752316 RepID=UPI001ADEE5B3|nr:WbqC family protein [Rhodoferax sp. AJA081-3]QTN30585.1 WbqC family protein [Rhodoferax sp. AJA081-3]